MLENRAAVTDCVTGKAGEVFNFEAMPDDANALRNQYVAQTGDCEILKGWKTRYTAPKDVTDVTWWYNPGDQPKPLGVDANGNPVTASGSPYEQKVTINASWRAFYKGKKDGADVTSDFRRVTSGQLECPVGEDGFRLTLEEDYTKVGFWPKPPTHDQFGSKLKLPKPAISYFAQVNLKGGGPLSKFQWGYIQCISGSRKIVWTPSFTWNTEIPTWTIPANFTLTDVIPANPKLCDPQMQGEQLYDGARDLGSPGTAFDTPYVTKIAALLKQELNGNVDWASYELNDKVILNEQFNVHVVGFHKVTKQYVPLRQWDWKLNFDTSQKGPWKAQPAANESPVSLPPDARNQYHKYSLFVVGQKKQFTKPK